MPKKIGIVLALDGEKEFAAGMKNAQESVRLAQTELKSFEKECAGNANTLESLTKKEAALKNVLTQYKAVLSEARDGQKHANDRLEEAKKKLDELKKSQEDANKKLEESKKATEAARKATEGNEKAVKEARKELFESERAQREAQKAADGYKAAIERQELEIVKCEASVKSWDTKVVKANGDVSQASREINKNSRYLQEARGSADGCATSIDKFGKEIKAAGDSAAETSIQLSSTSDAMSEMKRGLLSGIGMKAADALAGVGKAAVDAARKLIDAGKAAAAYADEILTTSNVTGMSTDRIQELTYAAGLMDTEFSTIEGSMRKNLASMRSAAKGTGETSDAYKKLGVEVARADGALRDSEDVYWDCIDALGRIEDSTERDSVAMQIFGKSAQELNPLIKQGSKGFANLAKEAHNVGYVLDSETLGKLGSVQDSFDRLDMAGQNFQNTIGAAIAPALGGFADLAANVLNGIAGLFRDNRTEAAKFADELKNSASEAQGLLDGTKNWKEEAAQSEGELESYRSTLLAVVRAEKADEYQKIQVGQIVDKLKDSVPELSDAWDEQTGTLKLTTDEVNALIDAQEKYARESVVTKAKTEAYEALYQAELDAAKAQGLINSKFREAGEKTGQTINSFEDLEAAYNRLRDSGDDELLNGLVTAMHDVRKAEEALDACDPVIEDAKKQVEELSEAAKLMGEDVAEAGESAEGGLKNVSDAAEEAMPKAIDAVESFQESARKMADSVQEAFDDAHGAAESAFSIDAFESWEKNAENGIQKMQESLEKQAGAMEAYSGNFAIVSDELRETAPEFLGYIQDLGKDGAQLVEELANAFRDGNTKAAEELIKKYQKTLDAREEIADVSAKNVVALKKAKGEFGSTAKEWEGLEAAVLKVRNSGLPEELASELYEALTTAKEEGVKIPEGLTEAISSSDNDPAEAARTCITKLTGAINAQKSAVHSIAKDTGNQVGAGLILGMEEKYGPVMDAATGMINVAIEKARARARIESPSKAFRDEVGIFLPQGLAEGVKAGNSLVVEAAEEQMNVTLAAMIGWLKGHKADADEIAYTWQAMATAALKNDFGIAKTKTEGSGDKQKTVGKTKNEYAGDILTVATSYLSNLKELYNVSAQQEISYWKAVRKRLDSGTQAWITASGKIRKLQQQVSQEAKSERKAQANEEARQNAERLSSMEAYVSHREAMGTMSAKQEKNYWQKHISEFEKGSSQYRKISEKLVALEKQHYAERLSSMESYVSHREAMGTMSARQEKNYWLKYISEFEKGSEEYKKIAEKLVALEAQITSERLAKYESYIQRQTALQRMSVTREKEYWEKRIREFKKGSNEYKNIEERLIALEGSIGTSSIAASVLSTYQTYYSMSEKAEVQYWNTIRKTYKAGTADRLAADQAYLAAKEKLTARLADIESEYTEKIYDANAKYKDAVAARREAIYSAFGLFDAFESNSATGDELLFNIQSQAAGYEEWTKSLKELKDRGIFSDALMEELTDKGPTDIAAIKALLTLSDDQMKLYQEAYEKKLEISEKQAEAENKDIKKEVKAEIKELKADMAAAMADANEPITDELKAVATKIETVAEDQTAAIVAAFTKDGANLGGSVGASVSASTKKAAGITDSQTNGLTQKQTAAKTEALEAINSARKRKPLTEEERGQHAAIYTYLADKYGVAGSSNLYTKLAAIFGLPAYGGTGTERAAILAALKAHGLRKGTTSAGGGIAWMDEDLDKNGPEIIVRKSDKAILTRLEAADAVIPANLSKNLFSWGAYDPESFKAASMAYLNDKLAQAYNLQAQSSMANLAAVNQIIGILGEYLPRATQGHDIYLDSDKLVGGLAAGMSRELTRRSRKTVR